MQEAAREERRRLTQGHDRLTKQRDQLSAARRELLATAAENSTARVGERISDLDRQLVETNGELERVGLSLRDLDDGADEAAVRSALGSFTETWNELFPREKERLLRLLVEHVVYQPDTCDVELQLRASGIETLNDKAQEAST